MCRSLLFPNALTHKICILGPEYCHLVEKERDMKNEFEIITHLLHNFSFSAFAFDYYY